MLFYNVSNFSLQLVNGSLLGLAQIFGTAGIEIADYKLISLANALLQYRFAQTLCEYGALSEIDFQESI